MKNNLSPLAWISLAAFLLSTGSPAIQHQVHAQSLIQGSTPIAVPSLEADDEAIDVFVKELMSSRQIPGLSLAVIHDQKIIKTTGYGLLDRELTVKARPSSIFPIASMSKPITATAVMLLVENGQLDLDTPIKVYLPESPDSWNALTLRHVLTHTAGLPENILNSEVQAYSTLDNYVVQTAQKPLNFQPGEAWMYSNTGYNLAAAVVEKVSGQSFPEFVKARIFEPLEMNSSDVLRGSYQFSNRAMGYELARNRLIPIDVNFNQLHRAMAMLQGSGSVTSNSLDLSRWAVALQKGQLLSAESHAEMEKLGVMNSGLRAKYGLGWFVGDINGHSVVAHGGNLWGYSTSITRFTDDDLTIVVLTNKDNENGDSIAVEIAEQYLPELIINEEASAIADNNPALTAQILAYLQGDTSAITYTPEWQIALATTLRGDYITGRWAEYMRHQSAEALELIAQQPHPNGTRYRYRVTESDGTRLAMAVVTPEGLIAELGIEGY